MGRKALKKEITSDDIFKFTDKGLDIFKKELSSMSLTKNIKSPFHKDSNPSFRVKESSTSGLYIGVDYTTGKVYNGIQLVSELYGLDFKESIEKIAWDFNLTDKKTNYSKVQIIEQEKIIKPVEPIIYEFTQMPFKTIHHKYWNDGNLEENFLKQNNIYAASHIAINKKVTKIPNDEMCFIYVASDRPYGELKILRIGPTIDKSQKWRTNIPNDYIWGISDYEETIKDNLWVIKSRKDEMIAKLLGLKTVSIQSENDIILDSNMPKLLNISSNIVLCLGSDDDGVKKCKIVQQKYKTKYYNTPKPMLPDVNDLFSYSCKYGLRQLEKHIKAKKLL